MTGFERILIHLLQPVSRLIRMLHRSPQARLNKFARRAGAAIWRWRKESRPELPLPLPLPHGQWVLVPREDILGKHLWDGLPYEEEESRLLSRILQKGEVFFDLGANFGLFTLLAASRVGREGQVHAFEPSPVEFARLQANLRFNKHAQVIANCVAVGKTAGEVGLQVFEKGWGAWNTVGTPPEEIPAAAREIRVRQTTLDAYLQEKKLSRIDFIKVDVEGGELEVFAGAQHILDNLRPLVLCELDDQRARACGHTAGEVWDFLAAKDYGWYELPRDHRPPALAKRQKEFTYVNLLAVPREKAQALVERL